MVSCFVTHGVFPKESWRRFLGQDGAPPLFYADVKSRHDVAELLRRSGASLDPKGPTSTGAQGWW